MSDKPAEPMLDEAEPDQRARSASTLVEKADITDVPSIELMVEAAFSKYIARLGRLPAAMESDFANVVKTRSLYVLRINGRLLGSVILACKGDAVTVENLVVDPSCQGCGYGRLLMDYAEDMARTQGMSSVTLYTNKLMHENIALYTKIGFAETGRKTENGFDRVYFRKDIAR